MWTQIVGKIRLAQSPWINHSWHVTLYVTPVLYTYFDELQSWFARRRAKAPTATVERLAPAP